MKEVKLVGIDVGSTTIKIVILDASYNIVFSDYQRHKSNIKGAFIKLFNEIKPEIEDSLVKIKVAGSSGMLISDFFNVSFIQEVIASTQTIKKYIPETDVAIELGGEDAKVIYLNGTIDQRMNGACAGGTGAFIDQMAVLLNTDASGLNELAKNYETIYPIASRCGVFAKTDVQPLINEGVPKEDIAVSIYQAVVNQTISGLSAGKKIKGNVAFLGGPLTYSSELHKRFIETLDLKEQEVISPEHSRLYVAIGAAISAKDEEAINPSKLYNQFEDFHQAKLMNSKNLDPLFSTKEAYNKFKNRHNQNKIKRVSLQESKGALFLGIDAGSTTSKIVLIDEQKNLVHTFYANNQGEPLEAIKNELIHIYDILPENAQIVSSAVTGYGEELIKNALKIDYGEIETVAHYEAAKHFREDVDFILDIGGQDMKSLKVDNGIISSVMLNEACSSGCGSFIETFAKSLDLSVEEFAEAALFAKSPVDLGTRCTVFMNSKVKQSQKEGATVGDISAGISFSIIKNALFKVIRLKDVEALGENIVVQGGTFFNEAVLRALEVVIGKEVIRPDISGLMGAFGASIIALKKFNEKRENSKILSRDALEEFSVVKSNTRCGICGNNCLLTINKFNDNSRFITGNRCERASGRAIKSEEIPNMYRYKYDRLFNYEPLPETEAVNGVIGIPRVLNMYENYPFWHTFFTHLKYKVVLSRRSSKEVFEKGMDSIPSESVCYPAKLVHGHIEALIENGIERIFYPSIPYERKEDHQANNQFNCPVVTSYPETIDANLENIQLKGVEYIQPFLPIYNKKQMYKKIVEIFVPRGHSKAQLKTALSAAYEEQRKYRNDIRRKGEEILAFIQKKKLNGIVLAGRPYHVDPEINHGIADMIQNYNIPILTEDSIAHLARVDRPIRVVDQWVYHTRLYNSATFVSKYNNLEFVQLNSFGCGLDAVTTDQAQEIIERNNKIYTVIKIDEINNLGAARIRIRSLIAVMDKNRVKINNKKKLLERVEFTPEMKQDYTILAPQMAPIHFDFLEAAFNLEGYNLKVLPEVTDQTINEGLKYVNNDACYPSLIVVGQIMEAINSGNYDLNKVAVLISQTGGGCRATNYIAFIRKALKDAGYPYIPVISLNAGGLEKNSGFKISPRLLKKLVMSLIYGDLLSRVLLKVRPYERISGAANKLHEKWTDICKQALKKARIRDFKRNINKIVEEFDEIEIMDDSKPKVGIVGEILVKFHPGANNNIIDYLESEGAEVVLPDLTDFMLYSSYNPVIRRDLLKESLLSSILGKLAIKYIEHFRKDMKKALKNSKRFSPPKAIEKLAEKASSILSLGHQTGEGWFLTAEMIELLEEDASNIACVQPFACLPNHITGKAMIKKLNAKFPNANITPIDYDPGSSEVNQINRLKLMLSNAKANNSSD